MAAQSQTGPLRVGAFLLDSSPGEVAKFILTSPHAAAFSPPEKAVLLKAMDNTCTDNVGRWLTGSDGGASDDSISVVQTTNNYPTQDAAVRLLESTLTNPQESDALVSQLGVPWIRARLRLLTNPRLSLIARTALARA